MFSEMVTMRDGVRLATDVFLPEDGATAWPVIIERTPYDRRGISSSEVSIKRHTPLTRTQLAEQLAHLGYAVVMQDVRGRYGSEGVFAKYLHEGEDGVDTYTWLLQQSWCDGRLCTMGLSYGAHTQLAAAVSGAPGIAAMAIDTGGLMDAWRYSVRSGGAFEIKQMTWAFRHGAKSLRSQGREKEAASVENTDIQHALLFGDWRPGLSPLAYAPEYESSLLKMWALKNDSPELNLPSTRAAAYFDHFPDVPVLLLGSWNDPYAQNMLDMAERIKAKNSAPLRQIFGPWLHGRRSTGQVGEADFGAAATLDHVAGMDWISLRVAWFDAALGRRTRPLESDFFWQMQAATPPAWPIMSGHWHHHLASTDPTITQCFANAQRFGRNIHFDPVSPHPTPGGAITSGGTIMQGGIFDQKRKGVISHPGTVQLLTESLNAPMTIQQLRVTATIDTSSPFDLHALLVEESTDGACFNLTDGIRRQLKSGSVNVDLAPIFHCVSKGSKLRLLLSAANFPRFDMAVKKPLSLSISDIKICSLQQ